MTARLRAVSADFRLPLALGRLGDGRFVARRTRLGRADVVADRTC
jgi:hypothetical protein